VEVSYYKVGIVHLDINGRVTQENTGQTTRDEHRDETDRKEEAELNRILPPYKVAIQLNTFTADGTAMISVKITKKFEMNGFTPDINMWCAHTMKDKKAIARIE
jgi:hypothetical protein